ncbi:hypothetical protein [Phosphitispora sp. TUW77]|uniref:hypothetical protein n=1 Tax=Phosphitispora sp. TUW77 TaxID=3152361 RepID=UPI003AB67D83
MFPYTHICFANDVLGKISDEIILGAVFPDTVIAGFLEHNAAHNQTPALYRYLKGLGVFGDFSRALITHSITPKGLDYYCDEKYLDYEKGYAFEMARPLVKKVIKSCNLTEEMGWWKAHNFIEMGADVWLFEKRPEFHGYLKQALNNKTLILALSQVLSPFFDVPAAKLAMSFAIFGEYVNMDEITPVELAKKYCLQMTKKHGITIDIIESAKIIEEAVDIIEKTFPDFISYCQQNVAEMLEDM